MKLDGYFVAGRVKENCKARIKTCTDRGIRPPNLAIIQVGNAPLCTEFVKLTMQNCDGIGARATHFHYSKRTPDDYIVDKLTRLIKELNADGEVDGIIIQMPLVGLDEGSGHKDPDGYYTTKLCSLIAPSKDVDGLRPDMYAKLVYKWYNCEGFLPCTAHGILMLLDWYHFNLTAMATTVVGRDSRIARPIYQMLLNRDCEGTMVHGKCERDQVWQEMKQSKLIISAINKPYYFSEDDIDLNEQPTIIDCGRGLRDGIVTGDFCFDFLDHFGDMNLINHSVGIGAITRAALMFHLTEAWEYNLRKKGLSCRTTSLLSPTLKAEYETWSRPSERLIEN